MLFIQTLNDLSKTKGLHYAIHIIYILELCASNYATYDGLFDGADGIFKASTTYNDKTIIWIMFKNF
jgi:hypothetical protein